MKSKGSGGKDIKFLTGDFRIFKLVSACSCGKKNEYDVDVPGHYINTELLKALKFAKKELDKLGMGHEIVDKAIRKAKATRTI